MAEKVDFENLINKEKYQVFVVYSRAGFPFNFALHPWLVINKKGEISRYDIRHYLNKDKSYGYFHVNEQPPFQGFPTFFPLRKFFSKTNLIKKIEGDENSTAYKMIEFIGNTITKYPFVRKYSFMGPNCGTYVEWVLKNFPEVEIKLPWNSFGKDYKIKHFK